MMWRDSRPPYLRLAADLRAQIMAGDLPAPGTDKLPSIAQLLESSDTTSASVVQRALAVLSEEGLIESRHGRGTFVRQKSITPILATPGINLGEGVARLKYDLLEVEDVPAPADVASVFGVDRGELVVLRKQVGYRSATGQRVELVWNYYRTDMAHGTPLALRMKMTGGSQAYFESIGRFYGEMDDVVTGRAPTTEEAEILQLPAEAFVLRTLRCITDQDGTPIEVSVFVKGTHLFASRYRHVLR